MLNPARIWKVLVELLVALGDDFALLMPTMRPPSASALLCRQRLSDAARRRAGENLSFGTDHGAGNVSSIGPLDASPR